jgi:hypothetical protein
MKEKRLYFVPRGELGVILKQIGALPRPSIPQIYPWR